MNVGIPIGRKVPAFLTLPSSKRFKCSVLQGSRRSPSSGILERYERWVRCQKQRNSLSDWLRNTEISEMVVFSYNISVFWSILWDCHLKKIRVPDASKIFSLSLANGWITWPVKWPSKKHYNRRHVTLNRALVLCSNDVMWVVLLFCFWTWNDVDELDVQKNSVAPVRFLQLSKKVHRLTTTQLHLFYGNFGVAIAHVPFNNHI